MERFEVLKKLQDIIREAVDNDEVELCDSTVAADVEGWDSLAQVLILGEIQNDLGVKFTSSEINAIENVGQLVNAIMDKL